MGIYWRKPAVSLMRSGMFWASVVYTSFMPYLPVNCAWMAGLLEGEGSFGRKQEGTIHGSIVVSCHMTDRDVLQKLLDTVGAGTLTGPYKNGKVGHKLRYMFRVSGTPAYNLMAAVRPHVGERRGKTIDRLVLAYNAFTPKVFTFEHRSGVIQETEIAEDWCREMGLSSSGLYRTLVGQRQWCRDWRRIA